MLLIAHLGLIALAGLLITLFYAVANQYRREGNRYVRGAVTMETTAVSSQADLKAQIHLFWAAQMLELRLKGFEKERLEHPSILKEARKYLEGVCDSVADHHDLATWHRSELRDSLLARYLTKCTHDSLKQIRLHTTPAQPTDQSYQIGYEGGSDWVRTRRFSSGTSLLSAVNQWGFIG
ncbi:MAG: hypothetical protein IPM37_15365 [Hahellaceae bacterium]|nr:hypothetical protein [Hahellaceae bacterium]